MSVDVDTFKFPKISSPWNRDPENDYETFLFDEWAEPWLEFTAEGNWLWQEKVDGRNHRVLWNGNEVEHRGRTDRAEMPGFMMEDLINVITPMDLAETFGDTDVCLYGEAYGRKINGGGKYLPDRNDFVLFDVFIDGYFLQQDDVRDIAGSLGVDYAPIIGGGSIWDAAEFVQDGFVSVFGENPIAEGLILRPPEQLFDRHGNRIITKLKHKDFKKKGVK